MSSMDLRRERCGSTRRLKGSPASDHRGLDQIVERRVLFELRTVERFVAGQRCQLCSNDHFCSGSLRFKSGGPWAPSPPRGSDLQDELPIGDRASADTLSDGPE